MGFINEVLEVDREAPRKQRLTSHRIYERIRMELPEHPIGESTVRRYVGQRKREMGFIGQETFVPQSYGWGQEAQIDWYGVSGKPGAVQVCLMRESRHTSSGQECRYCSGDRQRCFCDSRGRCRTQRRTVSYGSSETVDPDGMVLQSAQTLREDLIVADIPMSPRPGWNAASNAAVMDESARLVGQSRDTVRENNGQST